MEINTFGGNFITPREVTNARGVAYTKEQIAGLAVNLAGVFKWCRDGYTVMPAPSESRSLLFLRKNEPNRFHARNGGLWARQRFAHEDKTSLGWIVIRFIPGSTSKMPYKQKTLLPSGFGFPNVTEVVWALIVHKTVKGIHLIPNILVRTSSFDDDGYPVVVGDNPDGIIIRPWKGHPDGMIGMVAIIRR